MRVGTRVKTGSMLAGMAMVVGIIVVLSRPASTSNRLTRQDFAASGWGSLSDTLSVSNRRPLGFYVGNGPTPFAAPAPLLAPIPAAPPHKLKARSPLLFVPASPVPVPDRFADYVCTGIVGSDGQSQALIENAQTHEGWYLKMGETWQGATVVGIDGTGVTLTIDGQPRRFALSTTYNLTPLNSSANQKQGTAQQSNRTRVSVSGADAAEVQANNLVITLDAETMRTQITSLVETSDISLSYSTVEPIQNNATVEEAAKAAVDATVRGVETSNQTDLLFIE